MPSDPSRPIRILRVVTNLNIAGPTMQAVSLSQHMQAAGYETRLAGGPPLNETDDLLRLAQSLDLTVDIIPTMRSTTNPTAHIPALRALVRLMREYQPDVVHTHGTTGGLLGRIAARLSGVPAVVHTLHLHPFRGYYTRQRTLIFTWVERLGARLSDSIVTLSEALRGELADRWHITRKSRMIVLPLGFDLTHFAQTRRHLGQFRQAWDIPADAPLIGVVGRLLAVKNIPLFLQAARLIRAEVPDARFAIIGDGLPSYRQHLHDLATLHGLRDAVVFCGWQNDMAAIYSDLDVLTNTSLNEGTPIPVIEALAAGCRVVATDVGGVHDLLDHGRWGALVPSGDADALAAAIITALNTPYDPEPARATMERRYGIERLVKDMDSLYRGLLAKKGALPAAK